MIDPATGMKPGERYRVENLERAHQFPGFFLDGKYYLGPELLTAIGWLEGQRFIYDELDATGEPVFPGRAAGDIADLTLTLVDGTRLKISAIEHWPPEYKARRIEQPASAPAEPKPGRSQQPVRGMLVATALLALAGCVLTMLRRRRR
nr:MULTISPECIES: short chain dehydrogenase [unclassified Pseudomonas]